MKVYLKHPIPFFQVVFAGDAAVGKTSFINRITKGVFLSNLSSTLGLLFYYLLYNLKYDILIFLGVTHLYMMLLRPMCTPEQTI